MHKPSSLFTRKDKMQVIGIVLLLISVGTIVGPVGAVVVMYHNDLTQLVIPPQIRDIMNGNNNILPTNNNSNDNGNSDLGGLMTPVLVSATSNLEAHSFTGIFNVTNPFNYDLTLNSFSSDVEFSQENIPAGSFSLGSPATVNAGETSQLTITGHWNQDAQDYITNIYSAGATSVDISISNIAIDVNGIVIQSAGSIHVGNVPMSWQ